jgi:hypothetical protein
MAIPELEVFHQWDGFKAIRSVEIQPRSVPQLSPSAAYLALARGIRREPNWRKHHTDLAQTETDAGFPTSDECAFRAAS